MENIHFESRLNTNTVKEKLELIRDEIHKIVIGQDQIIDQILIALLATTMILIIRQTRPELAMLVSVVTGTILFLFSIDRYIIFI